jgi:alpha-tubulin N-acetyltransferase 1
MGIKKLFIHDELGNIKEISPLCVLDFYVHENQQRTGIGKVFDKFDNFIDTLQSNAGK